MVESDSDAKAAAADKAVEGPGEDFELSDPSYEIFVGVISILSLLNIALYYVFSADAQLQDLLDSMNIMLSFLFMVDFLARMIKTQSRVDYFFKRYGWADLLGSMPFQSVKFLRIFRLIRIFRLFREYGTKNVLVMLVKDRAGSSLFFMLMLGIFVMEFGSLAILKIEQYAPGANIKTASDALWYTIATISTVGYGDQYPVTEHGRFVGSIIIVVGVGIFGTFAGYVANFFLDPGKNRSSEN